MYWSGVGEDTSWVKHDEQVMRPPAFWRWHAGMLCIGQQGRLTLH